ncbi:MAG: PEP-CTERM sorting domain-containing protein [Proteobacteria bacterium]|nr:PEP-CTERM sorting domain-containing protein [Pseudomonadota bacterium]
MSSPCVTASDGSTECIVGYSGFGDPVGRGGGTDAEADFFSAFDQGPQNGPTCPNNLTEICFTPQTITPFTLDVTGGGVPEPASWALMITGFGLMGAALRRRRMLSYS